MKFSIHRHFDENVDCYYKFVDDGYDRPKPREGRPPLPIPSEYKCLIRAKSSSQKLSTVVSQDDVPKVMEEYSKILKNGMDNLKKVKRNKNKSKAAQGL